MGSTALPHLPASGVPAAPVIADSIERLARGEVIALPTETVYGLAVRADDPAALDRLAALKGRAPGQSFTWHASDATAVADVALPHVIGRLARRYWPGPLTLVVADLQGPRVPRALAQGGWTGVRVPAHAGTRALLAAAPFPIAATSANRTGARPAVDAAGVRATFGVAEVPLVLDGGRARLAESSTVAAIGPQRFEVLREGIVSASDLRRAGGLSLTFVCTGNTCRSPMAEGLARHALSARLGVGVMEIERFGFEVSSAGVYAGPGAPASDLAVRVLARRGIDLSQHASMPASSPSQLRRILNADRVYCLTASHREALLGLLPPGKGEHIALLDPEGSDVPDPFGGPVELYAATAEALERMIEARLTTDWI
jgi:L-threonylcarbamoyladenylate synthase